MKKAILIAGSFLLLGNVVNAQEAVTRSCGIQELKNHLIAEHPEFAAELKQRQVDIEQRAQILKAAKTTNGTLDTIPVVFHFVLDSAQVAQLGGEAGIAQRVDSQIVVINRDYNAMNSDSTKIFAAFKPLYANVGIHFGLAHTGIDGHSTPGYEIVYTSAAGFTGSNDAYSNAKHTSTGGANSWDVTRYLNVWIINTTDASGLLGITVPKSFTGQFGMPLAEMGIVINYGAFGVQAPGITYFYSGINAGRTLTHELGHFFEIWHTWGDDNGLCPWNGGSDDGIADTPPQASATYGDPTAPIHDACDTNTSDPGIMWMNYMDYVNDASMHLFTKDQANIMDAQVMSGGESYGLTQNPDLLHYPLSVANVEVNNDFNIVPNPTTGQLKINFTKQTDDLQAVSVVNMLGQAVYTTAIGLQNTSISIDLSGMSKGIYFVQSHFSTGTLTKKILLQ